MVSVVENEMYKITEGSTQIYTVTLVDESGDPIPLAQISSIQLTYKNDLKDTVINTREDQNVLNANDCTYHATDGTFTWNLQVADTTAVNADLRFDTNLAVITWTWNGGLSQQRHAFYIQTENLGRTCWQNFINRVAIRLGGGRRTIEMTDDHWCEAIRQAMDLINTYVYRPEWAYIGETSDENTVIHFDDIDNYPGEYDANVRGIVRVLFKNPNAGNTVNLEDPFQLYGRMIAGGSAYGGGGFGRMAASGRFGFGDIAFWNQHSEAVSRQANNEPDWLWDQTNRQLAINLPSQVATEITYLKAYSYTPANLPTGYFNYFLKALEGYGRLILSDIRGKFGGSIPGPTGTTETDAQTQQQKGENLIREVEETMRNLPLQATPEFG